MAVMMVVADEPLLQGGAHEHGDPVAVLEEPEEPQRPWMNGYTVFAVAVILVLGLWQFLAGLTAVVRAGLYVAPPGYTFSFRVAGWGWVLLLLGVLSAGAGVGVLVGRSWGDKAAIVLASLSMIVNFLLVPFYPIWSLVIIALDLTFIGP